MDNACSTQKKCCWTTLFKGALVGGAVMFVWFWVSWTQLSWHKTNMLSFKKERPVAAVLANTAPADGIYVLPFVTDPKTGAVGPEAVTKPYAFVSVYNKGYNLKDMKGQMLQQLWLCLFGGLLLTKFLKKTPAGCCPVSCSVALGLFVGSFAYLPNMIWYHFPVHYSLIGLADCVIAITLAGAAVSKVLKSGACPGCGCNPCNCKGGDCGSSKPAGSCSTKKGSCGG